MRVLFVTYYYPPSGGPGVQRALKFSRYLPDSGWQPVVLSVREDDAAWPARDESLLEEIPTDVEVHRTPAFDPYAAYAALVGKERNETVGVGFLGESDPSWKERLGRWIRANIFLPDARVGWVPYAIGRARAILDEGGIDAIWTTGPPHSTHLIGRYLARRYRLPWVADFRDPWVGIDYAELLPSTGLAQRIDARLERSVLENASAVTAVSPSMIEGLSRRLRRDYHLIYNGFDTTDFEEDVKVNREQFVVAHVGSLNEARNPEALFRALADLNERTAVPRLRVQLIGRVDPIVFETARRLGVDDLVDHVSYLVHSEAVRRMQQSALLVLVINRVRGAEGILTGKLFEYIGSKRPVICLGPPEGDAARVLAEVGAGNTVDHDDVEGVAEMLSVHYRAWANGKPEAGATPEAAARFSRRSQAEALALLLTQVTKSAREEERLS